jgi:DNA uptake protein ComE-like DNA-binding protein
MNAKKIERFLKEYFYFSQTERRGFIGLVTLIIFLLALPTVYGWIFPPPPFHYTIETLTAQPDDSISVVSGRDLFEFDPNTAPPEVLKQLGFTDKNIRTLLNYRSKGGRYKQASDLKKMFGIKPDLAERLMPYVVLNAKPDNNKQLTDSLGRKKQVKGPLELNTADTTALIALYRIGPAMARRIVEYRDRLGGFVSLQQLTEVYGFDEDILYDLQGKIAVDASKAVIFDVNEVSTDQLKTHPYFKYKLSNAIVNYRTQHGPYQSLTDLKKIVLVNDSIYRNITLYLSIK